jgi:hypothetical protein
MQEWKVTLKTSDNCWSTIAVEADSHMGAVAQARRLLGNHPVTSIT